MDICLCWKELFRELDKGLIERVSNEDDYKVSFFSVGRF